MAIVTVLFTPETLCAAMSRKAIELLGVDRINSTGLCNVKQLEDTKFNIHVASIAKVSDAIDSLKYVTLLWGQDTFLSILNGEMGLKSDLNVLLTLTVITLGI